MKTLGDLKWLVTAGKPSPALKAAALLYLHGVRVSSSVRLKVSDANFSTSPTTISLDDSRVVFVTDELSNLIKAMTVGKPEEALLLGYRGFSEFNSDFRRMVRACRTRFYLSDIKEMYRAAAGNDYALLKQYDSAQPFTADDVRRAWLKVLPKLVVGVK